MSVQTQIDRISDAVSAVKAALTEKGVTVPDGTQVDGLAALIAAIEAGGGSGGGEVVAETGTITCAETITIETQGNGTFALPISADLFPLAYWMTTDTKTKNELVFMTGIFYEKFENAYAKCIDNKVYYTRYYSSSQVYGKDKGIVGNAWSWGKGLLKPQSSDIGQTIGAGCTITWGVVGVKGVDLLA